MIRSGTINTIHELAIQGKSIREIARIVGILFLSSLPWKLVSPRLFCHPRKKPQCIMYVVE